jgi:pimeloyl-ACP methyl ester carboxylesterase
LPTIDVNGTALAYDDTGGDGPAVVVDRTRFATQPRIGRAYRVVGYDDPGVDSAIALIERLELAPCHFVGGLGALRLAARRPELLRSATVLSARGGAIALSELVGVTVPILVLSDGGDPVAQSIADTVTNGHHVKVAHPEALDGLLADLFEAT